MKLIWLEDLLAVSQCGTLLRAAQQRHVTHPAFGRRIKALEDWAGTALIDRSTYPLKLTAEGEQLLGVAQDVGASLSELRGRFREKTTLSRTSVRIATGRTLGRTQLPALLAAHAGLLGKHSVHIKTGSVHDAAQLLEAGDADLLLTYAHPDFPITLDPALFEHRTVGHERLLPVCAADRKGRPLHAITPSKRFALLAFNQSLILGRIVESHLRIDQLKLKAQTVVEADFAETLHECARLGLGVAWLPEILVRREIESGALAIAAKIAPIQIVVRIYRSRAPNRNALANALFEATII